jgi:hypothetical protein
MPRIDFDDDEQAAVAKALRKLIDEDRFPLSPAAVPGEISLGKAAPQPAKKPLPPPCRLLNPSLLEARSETEAAPRNQAKFFWRL